MASEVGNGQRLIEYYTNDTCLVVLMGQVFKGKTGDVNNFPMGRSVRPQGHNKAAGCRYGATGAKAI